MQHRPATAADLPLLAEWNHRLIRDEAHRNPKTDEELRRLACWLRLNSSGKMWESFLRSLPITGE